MKKKYRKYVLFFHPVRNNYSSDPENHFSCCGTRTYILWEHILCPQNVPHSLWQVHHTSPSWSSWTPVLLPKDRLLLLFHYHHYFHFSIDFPSSWKISYSPSIYVNRLHAFFNLPEPTRRISLIPVSFYWHDLCTNVPFANLCSIRHYKILVCLIIM